MSVTFDAVLGVFLGGAGRFFGPIVGVAVLQVLRELVGLEFLEWQEVMYGALLIAGVAWLPGGSLIGLAERIAARLRKPAAARRRLAKAGDPA
jgi:branched-chain amino acid transport system permease protein